MHFQLTYSVIQWHLLHAFAGVFAMDKFARAPKRISYPWWKRLWRIYRYLRRQKRKRKDEEWRRKFKKKYDKKQEKKRKRAIKRRARRLALRGMFKPKRQSKEEKAEEKRQQKKEKAYAAYRRRRFRRFVFRRYRQITWDMLSGKGLPKRKRARKRPSIWREAWHIEQIVIMLNSLAAFLLSYYFVMMSSKLATAVAALLFNIKTVIHLNTISFIVEDSGWTMDAIKTIFSAGPMMAFLVGIGCVLLYSQVHGERGVLKLVLLWGAFHGVNQLVMGTLVGSLMGEGMGYVIMYSYFMDTAKMVIALLMILLALALGLVAVRIWIRTANSYYTKSDGPDRPKFILSQVFLPYLLGNVIIYFIAYPNINLLDFVVNISLMVFLLPTFLVSTRQPDVVFEVHEEVGVRWRYVVFIFALLFIAAVRYALYVGIRIW